MTEQLTIARLGHRGDGVADTPTGRSTCPTRCPARPSRSSRVAGHPDRRHLLQVDKPSPERVAPISPHFGTCGGCALQHWALAEHQRLETSARHRGAGAGRHRRAGRADLIDAHGEGRRRVVLHARRGDHDVLEVGFRRRARTTSFRSTIARFWRPSTGRRHRAPPGRSPEAIRGTRKAARHPGHGDRQRPRHRCARHPGRLTRERSAALAKVAETHKLARITRHGELVAQRAQPIVDDRARARAAAAGRIPAGDRGRRGNPGAPRARACRQGEDASPICSAGSAPFALAARRKRARCGHRQRPAALDALQARSRQQRAASSRSMRRRAICSAGRSWRPNSRISTPWCSIRRARAPRRRRASSATSAVPVVVAVSCDATRSRAMPKILIDGGYKIASAVTPVDQFRYSPHVEIVAKFTR